jgi:N-acetyl-1-D-myo-inositol-2-amino-2-deoxy-alpha-D-glucopyranoside deacetylase
MSPSCHLILPAGSLGSVADVADEAGRRLLLVHAHPDDESIETGATMARYAAQGARVSLVTCTLGELGEVIPAELGYLAWDANGGLGEYRIGELEAACAALGVSDHRFLGGPGRWRDSGMMGTESNDWPGCFWLADVDEAARELLGIIEEVRPQVMISYDANGFYGHPDHIQAHRVARRAFALADGLVSKLYATALPRSVLPEAMALMPAGDAGPGTLAGTGFIAVAALDDVPFGVDDSQVTTQIDGAGYLAAKLVAMRAHRTQISVHGQFFALSDMVGRRALGTEYYTLIAGPPVTGSKPARAGGGDTAARETDLFAGIE